MEAEQIKVHNIIELAHNEVLNRYEPQSERKAHSRIVHVVLVLGESFSLVIYGHMTLAIKARPSFFTFLFVTTVCSIVLT